MKKQKTGKKTKGMCIQHKLYALLALFTFVIIVVVWLFQVLLLSKFYENSKRRELKLAALALSENLTADDLDVIVNQYAEQYQVCISIYQIMKMPGFGNIAVPLASADVYNSCIIHHLSVSGNSKLNELYQGAQEAGGELLENVSADEFFGLGLTMNRDGISFRRLSDGDAIHKINVKIVSAEGTDYVIMLDAELTPLNAIIRTRNAQIYWITVITLVLAFIMAFLMSRFISKPVKRMNDAAKQLAEGKYDVSFDGSGCRELRELGETLNFAAAELSRTDALQKELISNVSHDLRTPLTMIKGYSEVMRDIPGEATTENIQIIIDETTRLSELVNDMLDLSRLQAGTREPLPEVLDLSQILREVTDRYSAMLHHRNYDISCTVRETVWTEMDRTMLLQILYNLVNNAVNYTGDDKTVVISQEVKESAVRVSVRDTGEGISPDQLPLIWDRYYKIDRVHRRAMVGTGLGLSIVKELLELQHCPYGVDSTPGTGATFWFEVPLVPPPEQPETSK